MAFTVDMMAAAISAENRPAMPGPKRRDAEKWSSANR
jgi:hypothetical protein